MENKSENEDKTPIESIEQELGKKHCKRSCQKLDSFDWLQDISELEGTNDFVEVQFKNTRKAYYQNQNNLRLVKGDIVAVEASPGHDMGVVCLTGQIVLYKLQSEGIDIKEQEFKKVYRKAKHTDIEKWKESIDLEIPTMLQARQIANDLKLDMKIGDVEYQGDKTKAIFYYIADERVDFRELIKLLAEKFRVRIEMRQIGARQEAGRIGGIGSCGRELCCSAWITNFVSVTTNAARYQEVSLNPQKLAGQCSKLKCCLNYELDAYLDAQENFPDTTLILKTKEGDATHQKTDVFRRLMWYIIAGEKGQRLSCLSVDQVKDIVAMNEKGKLPEKILTLEESSMASVIQYENAAGLESLTRFEDKPSKNNGSNQRRRKKGKANFKNKKRRKNEKGNS